MKLTDADYDALLEIARQSIFHGFKHHAASLLNPVTFSKELRSLGMLFISIKTGENYLGCQGNLDPMPLFLAASQNSFKSAFRDHRYPPLNKFRARSSNIQLHHLYEYRDYENLTYDEILGIIAEDDSIYLSCGQQNSIMLSIMQPYFKTKKTFLEETAKKARFNSLPWKSIKVRAFKTYVSKEINIGEENEIQIISGS